MIRPDESLEPTGAWEEHLPIPRLGSALLRLVTREVASGALTVSMLVATTLALEVFGNFGVGLGWALFAGYALHVVHGAAHGSPRLPEPADFEGLESWLLPLPTAVLAFLPLILPIGVHYALEGPQLVLASMSFQPPFSWSPARVVMAAIGIAFVPPGLVSAAVSRSVWAPLHLVMNVKIAVRAGRTLAVQVSLLWVLFAWAAAFELLGGPGTPAALAVGLRFAFAFGVVLVAFALGWTVYERADDFGIPRRPEHVRRRFALETGGSDA